MNQLQRIIAAVFISGCAISFAASAGDTNTNVDVGNNATAQTIGGAQNQTFRQGDTYVKVSPAVPLPNTAASLAVNPTTFLNNGAGLAERTAQYSRLFAQFTKGVVSVNGLNSKRGETKTTDTDFAVLVWQPYSDYYNGAVNEDLYVKSFSPMITDMSVDFGAMSPTTNFFVIGHVAVVTPKGSDLSDAVLQETLIAEAEKFLVNEVEITGFTDITPMVIFETTAFYQGSAVTSGGYQISPQVSMFPGAGVGTGSFFSFQDVKGQSTPEYRLGMKIVFLAKATNAGEGHAIVAKVQQISKTIAEKAASEKAAAAERSSEMAVKHSVDTAVDKTAQ